MHFSGRSKTQYRCGRLVGFYRLSKLPIIGDGLGGVSQSFWSVNWIVKPRYNNNTNTRQNKTFFHDDSQIFWRFSDRIMPRQNATCDTCRMWRSISHLYVSCQDLASENHNFVFHQYSPWETFRDVLRVQRTNQSASQECRFATNQRPRVSICLQSASQNFQFATPTKKKTVCILRLGLGPSNKQLSFSKSYCTIRTFTTNWRTPHLSHCFVLRQLGPTLDTPARLSTHNS